MVSRACAGTRRAVRAGMRIAAAVVLLSSSLASAAPFTAGVAVGKTQNKADEGYDANGSLGVFGRLGFSPRVSGQLEVQRITTDSTSVDIRTITGLLVVDLGTMTASGRLVPMLMVGYGFDRESYTYGGSSTDGYHIEGGFGLEYRADGGLSIGGDARMGGRGLDNQTAVPLTDVAYYNPSQLHEGEYRSARVYAAVRF